jgi:hypothetical protein
MMIELDRGCAHLVFPCGVCMHRNIVAYGGFKKNISESTLPTVETRYSCYISNLIQIAVIACSCGHSTLSSLRKFLYLGSFYSLGEYIEWKLRDDLKSYK